MAHVLTQYAKNIVKDMNWMEDSPPFTRKALYHYANFIG